MWCWWYRFSVEMLVSISSYEVGLGMGVVMLGVIFMLLMLNFFVGFLKIMWLILLL